MSVAGCQLSARRRRGVPLIRGLWDSLTVFSGAQYPEECRRCKNGNPHCQFLWVGAGSERKLINHSVSKDQEQDYGRSEIAQPRLWLIFLVVSVPVVIRHEQIMSQSAVCVRRIIILRTPPAGILDWCRSVRVHAITPRLWGNRK